MDEFHIIIPCILLWVTALNEIIPRRAPSSFSLIGARLAQLHNSATRVVKAAEEADAKEGPVGAVNECKLVTF